MMNWKGFGRRLLCLDRGSVTSLSGETEENVQNYERVNKNVQTLHSRYRAAS